MKNIGLYVRVSTIRQALRVEGSLDTQVDTLQKYVDVKRATSDEPWEITETYREEGKSGKDTDRPEYQRMLTDIRAGRINALLCTKIDRVSRSLMDFFKLHELLERHEVTFISLHENWDTSTPMGRFGLKLTLAVAELERETLAERVREKTAWRRGEGFYVGGPCLGYDFDPERRGMLNINKEEAALVRLIYETYLVQGSVLATTEYLNKKGYRGKTYLSKRGEPRGGGTFFNTGLTRILTNPLYVGKILEGENLIEGKHEGVVPIPLWERVQRRIRFQAANRHNVHHERQYSFLLEGIIRCGECSGAMTPRWAQGRSRKYYYYECVSRAHKGNAACTMKDVPAPALDTAFVQRIKELGSQQSYIKDIAEQANDGSQYELSQLELRRKSLERQLAQGQRKLQRWSDLLASSEKHGAQEQLLASIGRASQESKSVEAELRDIADQKEQIRRKHADPLQVINTLHSFADLWDAATDIERKTLLRLLVHQVIWTSDEVKYALYEQPNGQVVEEGEDGSPLSSGWYARQDLNL